MIRVLVVDDSALVRKVLSEQLSEYKDIEVVGTAMDPYVARDKIVSLHPDVITLDIEMPRMDGLSFLGRLMKHHPIPVVIVSSLAPENGETALRALELGAVEIVSKPGSTFSTPDVDRRLIRAIRAAVASKPRAARERPPQETTRMAEMPLLTTHRVVAIGASTGGPQAIETLLMSLPATGPGMVLVQHMPETFTRTFAERLNRVCAMEVREASDGDAVVPGTALIAPGNHHMLLERSGATYHVRLKDGPQVYYQRPSIDVLFHSVARAAGPNAVGALLTGMGADGAKGLLAMRRSGGRTFAQDEQSSVVFGMPREAILLDAVDAVLPLGQMASGILEALHNRAAA